MQPHEPQTFVIILAIAALAPFICEWPRHIRLPLVVLEIGLGILVGPHVLGRAESGPMIQVFSNFGMAFLFFMAGFEINFQAIRGRPMSLTGAGWLISLVVGLAAGFGLQWCGVTESGLIVGAALTTTALGTLMPILRIATVLGGGEGEHGSLALMLVFAATILIGVWVAINVRPPHLIFVMQEKMHTSAQLPVRVSVLALAGV